MRRSNRRDPSARKAAPTAAGCGPVSGADTPRGPAGAAPRGQGRDWRAKRVSGPGKRHPHAQGAETAVAMRARQALVRQRVWRPPHAGRGLSLLELLVATTLGALLTVALTQLFASGARANAAHTGQARLQESARHALGFLGDAIRGAGFFGCGGAVPGNSLRGDWRQIVELDLTRPVEGFDGVAGAARWQPDLSALPLRGGGGAPLFRRRAIDAARLRPGSDLLLLRRLATPLHPLRQGVAAEGDPVVALDPHSALRRDRFAVLTRCGAASLFRITSASRRRGAARLARAVGAGPFGNRAGGLLAGTVFGAARGPAGAAVGLVLSEIYFVARGAGRDNRGGTVWSLWRKTSAARPAELVRGVEELQVLFGVLESPAAAAGPARLMRPSRVPPNAVVRSVHVSVTASSVAAVGDGAPVRHTFAATFAVRNP